MTQKEELRSSKPTRRVADGIGERKAWVCPRLRQGEHLCSAEGEPVLTVAVVLVTTVVSALSALHEPPYTGTVRTVVWEDGGGDTASYPIGSRSMLGFMRSRL